ncbi:MAG: hypothetical protein BGO98_33070 [Myxococcales bacterium 68-20]|nr:MAG: hypothetical protein BGO98_33070 [Myxococcales bacterium 68-20]
MPRRSLFSTRWRWFGVVVVLAGLLAPASASAEPRERIHFDYSADPTCPSFDAFVEQVRAYTSRWGLAAPEEDTRRLRVTFAVTKADTVGTLEIASREQSAPRAPRTIVAPDCATVARGMAVAVAVAIDPAAILAGPGRTAERELTDELAEEELSAEVTEATPVEQRPSLPAPSSSAPPREPSPSSRRPVGPRTSAARFAIEGRLEVTSAVVDGLLPGALASIEVDPLAPADSSAPLRLPRWLRPTLALGIRQSISRKLERSTVATSFLWTAGVVRLCPVRLGVNDKLDITPCLESDVGVLTAEARGSADARRTSSFWLDLGVSVRVTWTISPAFYAGTGIALVAPLSRNWFELGTGELISRAPPVGGTLGGAFGWRF